MKSLCEQLEASRQAVPEAFPDPDPADGRRVADAAVEGILLFYGTEPIEVGRRGIDWSGGHRRHQEWRAQLNRFGQLHPLRRAYRDTGDESYAQAARDYIADWLDAHEPYPPDAPATPAAGDSSLNAAIRLGGTRFPGWLGVLPDLLDSPAFDEAFAGRIADGITWQLGWLEGHLAERGNWRIAGLDALLGQALRQPQRYGRHLPAAVEELNAEFTWQILDDGAHLERSAGYHDWMCEVFLALWRLGRRRADLGLRLDGARVVRMHAYTLHHTKPNGADCGFNDARAAFRTTPQGRRHLAEVVAQHAAVCAETPRAPGPSRPCGPDPAPRAGLFPAAGHVFYRTGWDDGATWWGFDAGGWGGGHGHLSRLSIEMHNGGRTTLPDPGIFDYEMSNPFAAVGKATASHATMTLDLGNQADVGARLLHAVDLPLAVVAHGRYEGGYWTGRFGWGFNDGRGRGRYGVHDRIVVWLKDRAMIVLDSLTHDGEAAAYLHWVGDDVPGRLDADRLRWTTADAEGNVCVQVGPLAGARLTAEVHRGEQDPPLGWVARQVRDHPQPAPLLQCRFACTGRPDTVDECATVIVPFTGPAPPEFEVRITDEGLAREVCVEWAEGARDRVLFTRRLQGPIRRLGDVVTDVGLLILRRSGPEAQDAAAGIGGSFARVGGRDVSLSARATAVGREGE